MTEPRDDIGLAAAGAPARNGLFLLIDALRYDVVSNAEAREFMFPNLARIIDRGFVRRVVTNAQSTQFVMPAIFSQTYPLDHGGYDPADARQTLSRLTL
jgi:hypothetical protein